MPRIGILCDREQEKERISHTIELLAAREGLDCWGIRREETGDWEDDACVVISCQNRDAAFRHAEILWDREQSLLVIYVAHEAEDVFAALRMPFFHIVRSFDLERDFEAALRKLGRVRLSARISFTRNGQVMLIPAREILYVESRRHEIRLHSEKEVFIIKENLSQCEERLKGRGFVRIYTSFLVNMYHIRCLEKKNALLDNGERLYVSRRRYPEVKFAFEKYIRHLDFI